MTVTDKAPAGRDVKGGESHANPPTDSAAIIRSYAGKSMPRDHMRTFLHPDMDFAVRTIKAGAPVQPLTYGTRTIPDFTFQSNGGSYDIYDYVSRNRVAGDSCRITNSFRYGSSKSAKLNFALISRAVPSKTIRHLINIDTV